MNKIISKLIAFLLALQLVTCSVFSSSALSDHEFSEKLESTAAYLQSLPQSGVGSIGGEWRILGLARANKLSKSDKQAYIKNVEEYVCSIGSAKLHKRKSTDNSRVIIALSAVGKNAASVAGYDLTAPLADFDYVGTQGVNGYMWALIALDSCRYPIKPDNSISNPATREKLIEGILSKQCDDGGWTLSGNNSDPDMTAMAIQALAPYRFYDAEIQAAIDRALERLISLQQENGGYYSYDDFNPESCAQVIVALTALGIDPRTDERFNKSGKTLLDSIMRFSVENGFEHTLGLGYNQMATEQAFYSFVSYNRFLNHQTALYDMTDNHDYELQDLNSDGVFSINDVTFLQRYLAEYDEPLTVSEKRTADVNCSGQIDIKDVTKLQRMLVQLG